MQPAGAAFGFEFLRRHRWGLRGVLVTLAILGAIKVVVSARYGRVDFPNVEVFAFTVIVPMTAVFLYFVAVFTYGLSGDIAARESMYPRRMFTLPVTSAALAGWPMLCGCVSMMLLWFVTRLLGVWPTDVHVPMVWPALLAVSFLAWAQALTWMPYPLRGMRVVVTVFWLMIIDAIVMVALELKAAEGVMLLILAPHVPLAYLTARHAVRRARSGGLGVSGSRGLAVKPRETPRPRDFATPMRALMWFEWRQHGRSLPFLLALLLPFELAMLFVFRETPPIVVETLAMVLMTPPFMAIFVAATVSQPMTTFVATRPVDNATLIGAKLKVAAWSTLLTWVLVLIAMPLGVRLSGTSYVVAGIVKWLLEFVGRPRAIALALLTLTMLIASTWKQLVQSLYIGMSGREWAVKASVFGTLTLLAVAFPLALWVVDDPARVATVFHALPLLIALLACVKLVAAALVLRRIDVRGLLSRRKLLASVATWDGVVFAIYALMIWMIPFVLVRRALFLFVAILAVPLVRLMAAPLAVNTNRHR